MSGLGSIVVSISYTEFSLIEDFFQKIISCGWKFEIDNQIIYNPSVGDPYSDWLHYNSIEKEIIIKKAIKQLHKCGKVGLSMSYYEDYGWFVIIHRDFSKIEFINEIGKKKIDNLEVTDFSFHIKYIVESFTKVHISISEIECNYWV